MASSRASNPLADLVALIAGPIFVMLMVGSLVFFLIEVLYAGNYSGRLLYTMFFYVFGCVLIARVSIQVGRTRSRLYAVVLSAVCFLALLQFVEYSPGLMQSLGLLVNLGIMLLIWWTTDKLTWDCTHLHEDRKASGRGILSAVGLGEATRTDSTQVDADEAPTPARSKRKQAPGFIGWMERLRDHQSETGKKPHTPGITIFYFALAALPLFALGQSLINPADSERRWATFLYMAVYVGSALALLVTTSLFGLKKYLEERNAHIPAVMTFGWLGLGTGLILLFLAVGALLPRPHSETAWFNLKQAGSRDRDASRSALLRDEAAGKGDGTEGQKREAGDGEKNAENGKKGGTSGKKGDGGGQGKNGDGGKEKSGKQSSSGKEGTHGEQGKQSDSAQESETERNTESGSSTMKPLSQWMEPVSRFVKWLVWALVALAVLVVVFLFFLKWLAPFTKWAQSLLDWLWGWFQRPTTTGEDDAAEEANSIADSRPPPFAAFSNPFRDGSSEEEPPEQLTVYTFAALDSWAWDRDMGRAAEETPLEFAARLGHHVDRLDEPAYRVATLLVHASYSRSRMPGDTLLSLEKLWDVLEALPVHRVARAALIDDEE